MAAWNVAYIVGSQYLMLCQPPPLYPLAEDCICAGLFGILPRDLATYCQGLLAGRVDAFMLIYST